MNTKPVTPAPAQEEAKAAPEWTVREGTFDTYLYTGAKHDCHKFNSNYADTLRVIASRHEQHTASLRSEIETLRRERDDARREASRYLTERNAALLKLEPEPRSTTETQAAQKEVTSLGQSDTERDAARYRFLRDISDPDKQQPYICQEQQNSWGTWHSIALVPTEADALIDFAIDTALRGLSIVSTPEPQSTASSVSLS